MGTGGSCRGTDSGTGLMKILMLHNYYQQPGGEDVAAEADVELLRSRGHDVRFLTDPTRK